MPIFVGCVVIDEKCVRLELYESNRCVMFDTIKHHRIYLFWDSKLLKVCKFLRIF